MNSYGGAEDGYLTVETIPALGHSYDKGTSIKIGKKRGGKMQYQKTQKVQHQEFIHKLDEFMEHHNDEVEDQDEQIMEILKYLTEWLVNHILYVDGQIPKG